ncbi:MAG: calcium/sodium antiporter [Desulfobacterales bacterium]|nr:calcium/sodium antiporter [Desulfobacterales bacterium]
MDFNIIQMIIDGAFLIGVAEKAPTLILLLVVVICIAMLSKGADWMIDGVVELAHYTGLPRIVIGATIISLGTTTPEAVVSVMAAWMGNPGLALGNAVGSMIVNTGLIFGMTCLLATVPMNRFVLNRTGWVQDGAATLLVALSVISFAVMAGKPVLNRWVGFLFLVLLAAYMYASYAWARRLGSRDVEKSDGHDLMAPGKIWSFIAGGLFLVALGARILVPFASEIAKRAGVPDDIIAATLVAFGTSLPELMTAIAAVRKGHPEITVGNIVGANVLNCLFVIGASASASPLLIPNNFYYLHFPTMLFILFSFRFFVSTNKSGLFSRWQGAWLLGAYLVYLLLSFQ